VTSFDTGVPPKPVAESAPLVPDAERPRLDGLSTPTRKARPVA